MLVGGDFPHIHNCDCMSKNVSTYLTECIPMYNLTESKKNIYFIENGKQYTIYYSSDNDDTYIFDQNTGTIEFTTEKIIDDMYFEMDENLNNSFIDIAGTQIPLYYMSLNNDDIFNIYISNMDTNDNLFRISDGNFIGLSLTFNIFNLSFTTHSFFDVMAIFIKAFDKFKNPTSKNMLQNSRQIKTMIKTEFNKIYESKKQFVEKIHHLFSYKKKISTLSDVEQSNLLSHKTCEFGDGNKYDTIVQSLVEKFYNICEYLIKLSDAISCDAYKYMFLVSILSYRLNNKLIAGGWAFSEQKIFESLNEHITTYKCDASTFFEKKVTIYEYSMTHYNGFTYANCMENTIFQFLKLLFWNNISKKYDFNMIHKLVKEQYYSQIMYFFTNIQHERTQSYINNWTKFIMFNNVKYNFVKHNYELNATFNNLSMVLKELFIPNIKQDNVEFLNFSLYSYDITINVTINNYDDEVLLTLPYDKFTITLYHDRHASFTNQGNNNIIETIRGLSGNHSSQMFILKVLNDIRLGNVYNIDLYTCDKNIFQWVLLFAIYPTNANNILRKYYTHVEKNLPRAIDDIFSSIYFSQNSNLNTLRLSTYDILKDNTMINKYYYYKFSMYYGTYDKEMMDKMYMKNPATDEKLFDYFLLAKNANESDTLKIFTNPSLFDEYGKFKYFNNGNTLNIIKFIEETRNKRFKFSVFFNKLVLNMENFDNWDVKNTNDNPIWYYVIKSHIFDSLFWTTLSIHKQLFQNWIILNCDNDTKNLWTIFVKSTTAPCSFWENVCSYDLLKQWNYDTWKIIILSGANIPWNTVSEYQDIIGTIGDSFSQILKQQYDSIFWENISKNLKNLNGINWTDILVTDSIKSTIFWERIADAPLISNNWNYEEWVYVIKNISKHDVFWEKISLDQNNFKTWNTKIDFHNINDTSVWQYALKMISNAKFWENVSTNQSNFEYWKCDIGNGRPWIHAILNIKSDLFWNQVLQNTKNFKEWFINNNGFSHWSFAFANIESKKFWMSVSKNSEFVKDWGEKDLATGETICEYGIKNINILEFWKNIYHYDFSIDLKKKIKKNISLLTHKNQHGGNNYKEKYDKYLEKNNILLKIISK